MTLEKRKLGRTCLDVSAIGLGGAGIGGIYQNTVADRDTVETVELALTSGINFIDTSPLYGESERRLGIALRGVDRKSYFLSTKTGTHPNYKQDYSWDGTLHTVENSLKLLGADYFDILLVHDPELIEPVFAKRGALEALEWLREQGVVRNIGLGQRRHDFHKQAIKSERFDVILTFNDYHVTRTTALTEGLLEIAAEHNIGVLNGSPMGHGLLTGVDPRTLHTPHLVERDAKAATKFYDWCQSKKLNQKAIVLQSCLKQPLIHCTLTGAKNKQELHENLDALHEEIPDYVWEDLKTLKLTEGQV
ncbi:aldo/keto reductase [Armatimonas sp.]|uniref:aldo/keto reductase n=1 Tax=Armatimonas sp. TaxID=1872638 RepID=UPI00286B87C0|nr:aldo/keto reductase [Armatimonas sp.]